MRCYGTPWRSIVFFRNSCFVVSSISRCYYNVHYGVLSNTSIIMSVRCVRSYCTRYGVLGRRGTAVRQWPKCDGSQVAQPKSALDNTQLTCDDRNDQHFSGEGEVVLERHKRQPDTTYPLPHERSHLRSRINLPAFSKLAQRFPQHVRSDGAVGISSVQISNARKIEHTGTAQAESNKRRRILPFKMRGSTSGQCTEVGPS